MGRWNKLPGDNSGGQENSENRETPRIQIQRKVKALPLRPNGSHQPFWGGVRNISKKGVCIETTETLTTSHVILLYFKASGSKRYHAPAKVVWSKDKVSGLEFLDPVGIEVFLESFKK
jgi:hypothetical protein